ncbi:hypothetical protein KY339_01250 [Candidatus Woesearchaeota archaeon]|nr:hypothetical protein [Candidatus Woesearchaeota archaeon]
MNKKILLVMLVVFSLISVVFISGCLRERTEHVYCGEIITQGVHYYGPNDPELTWIPPGDPIPHPCVELKGSGIILDGQGVDYRRNIRIDGSNNEIRNFDFGQSGNDGLGHHLPSVTVINGVNNKIYDNEFYTVGFTDSGWLDGTEECSALKGGPGITLTTTAFDTLIYDNVFTAKDAVFTLFGASPTKEVCPTGPAIHFLGSTGNYIWNNDFVTFTGGMTFAYSATPANQNWHDPGMTYYNNWHSPYVVLDGVYQGTYPYQEAGSGAPYPFFEEDSDLDGVLNDVDNCVFMPNPGQQDLDGDGVGTPCDWKVDANSELDFNLEEMVTGVHLSSTPYLTFAAFEDLGFTFIPGPLELKDSVAQALLFDEAEFGIQIFPQEFGSPTIEPVYSFGPAGAMVDNIVECGGQYEGAFVTGGLSAIGGGASFGFDTPCVHWMAIQETGHCVEIEVKASPSAINVWKYWDRNAFIDFPGLPEPIELTGTSFTLSPDMVNLANEETLGIVFEPDGAAYTAREGLRFGIPTWTTSGEDVSISPEDLELYNNNADALAEWLGFDPVEDAGIYETLDVTEIPRGGNLDPSFGTFEVDYNGDGVYTLRTCQPVSYFDAITVRTKEISVNFPITISKMDILHREFAEAIDAWDRIKDNAKVDFSNTNIYAGSPISVIGAGLTEIKNTEIYLDAPTTYDFNDASIIDGALGGVVAVGGELVFENAVIAPMDTNPSWIGVSAVASTLTANGLDISGVGTGIATVHSMVDLNNVNIDSIAIPQFVQDVPNELQTNLLYECSEDVNDFQIKYFDEFGDPQVFELPTGFFPGLGSVLGDYGIHCGLTITNSNFHAENNLGGIFVGTGETTPVDTYAVNMDTITFNSNHGNDITILGYADGSPKVRISNVVSTGSRNFLIAGGSLDELLVEHVDWTGDPTDSTVFALVETSASKAEDRFLDLTDPTFLGPLYMNNVIFSDIQATNVGTDTYLMESFEWLNDNAYLIDIGDEPDISVYIENVVATDAYGESQNVALFGENPGEKVTVVNGPDVIVNPGLCTGNSSIHARVTSNDVQLNNGVPGQQPLADATVMAFDKNHACVAMYFPDATGVADNCDPVSTCTTGDDASGSHGECTIDCLTPGDYFVVVDSLAHPGKHPSHVVGGLADYETRFARFAFLKDPTGKVSPGKSFKQSGSELWIYEPDYVVWSGTEEYYPFVFETGDNSWTVDVCVDAPEGYEPADGIECLQTILANQVKSILFKLVEVGSVPGPVGVDMSMTDPHGKSHEHAGTVDMRVEGKLREKLEGNGMAFDKNGRLLNKGKGKGIGLTGAAVAEGAGSTLGAALLVAVVVLIGVALFLRKRR